MDKCKESKDKAHSIYRYPFFVLGLLLATALSSGAQSFQHADSAFSTAYEENKPLLLLFTGSDWCPNCLRLEKTVLSTKEFEDFARDRLILLTADFPQRKKQASELASQNDRLAQKYNPSGLFPTIVLFSPDGKIHTHIGYKNQSPEEFIDTLQAKINTIHDTE